MKLTKDELLDKIKGIIGEDMSDENISLIEDISDSFQNDAEDWKARYEENDRNWRKKYTDRFYGSVDIPDDDIQFEEPKKKIRFEDLFEEVK